MKLTRASKGISHPQRSHDVQALFSINSQNFFPNSPNPPLMCLSLSFLSQPKQTESPAHNWKVGKLIWHCQRKTICSYRQIRVCCALQLPEKERASLWGGSHEIRTFQNSQCCIDASISNLNEFRLTQSTNLNVRLRHAWCYHSMVTIPYQV